MKKSADMSVFQNWINILSNLLTAIIKLGGTADAFKNFNKQEIVDAVAQILVNGAGGLKFLSILKESIEITTSTFNKSLFTSSSSPKYYIWGNFQKGILNKASDVIPAFKGTLKILKLTKNMNDSAILAEIGAQNVFSISEALAILKSLTERQPNGELGDLLNNGYANFIYVRFSDNSIVPMLADWYSDFREWDLDACLFDGGLAWLEGRCVIVRG